MTEETRIRKNRKTLSCQQRNARAVVETRWRNKMRLIQYKGGKCSRCGYDKPIAAAYHFHHTDPDKKEFGLGRFMSRSLDRLKQEADKCEMLCANCHAEEHDKEHAVSREQTIKSWQDWNLEEEARRKRKLPTSKACPKCNNEFVPSYREQVYCGRECSIEARRSIEHPSPAEIQEMLKTMSCTDTVRSTAFPIMLYERGG